MGDIKVFITFIGRVLRMNVLVTQEVAHHLENPAKRNLTGARRRHIGRARRLSIRYIVVRYDSSVVLWCHVG